MADTLRIKRRAAGGAAGAPTSLAAAELAYNEQDDTLYYGWGNSSGIATVVKAIAGPGFVAGVASPIGLVAPYAGITAPSKWLFCYGQNVSRTTYAALWTVLSTTFGAGDGSTTFGIPDLRGRTIGGKDNMGGTAASRLTGVGFTGGVDGATLGNAGGGQYYNLITADLAAHTHMVNYEGGLGAGGGADYFTASGTSPRNPTSSTGSGGAHNNVQPTLILNYIIYAGV